MIITATTIPLMASIPGQPKKVSTILDLAAARDDGGAGGANGTRDVQSSSLIIVLYRLDTLLPPFMSKDRRLKDLS